MKAARRLAPLALALAALSTHALAAPLPISACGAITQPGSYQLVNNLFSKASCLLIHADFVTVDLDGYMIEGSGVGHGITDFGSAGPTMGITVRNGTVTNFDNGIRLSTETTAVIERMHVIGNMNRGITATSAVVRDNVVSGNLHNTGINVGPRSLVSGNVVVENQNGIVAALGSTVIGNTVGLNAQHGIIAYAGSTVVNNTSRNHSGFGISVTCPSLVLGNASTANGTNVLLSGALCTTDHNAAP